MSEIKIKSPYSDKMKAQAARVKRLPTIYNLAINAAVKKHAVAFKRNFQIGIAQKKFNLDPLKTATIIQKKRQGRPKPATPLYGKGETDPRSLINVFEVRQAAGKNKGWGVYRSIKKHWSGKLRLSQLLSIHEYGCTIKRGQVTIKIPARQAAHKAYAMTMRQLKNFEPEKSMVRVAINQFIRDGKEDGFKRIRG